MDYIYSEDPVKTAADHLVHAIKDNLAAGKKVLWFLSGGSGIRVVLAAARQLQRTDLTNLSVTLTDERYGPVGHEDENWQQLLDGGFTLPGANVYRTLIDADRVATSDAFGAWIMQQMMSADYKIGLFGIGSDGHTAGIKPHSAAVNTTAWADCYTGEDFERITITPFTISQIDEVVLQATGSDKSDTLRRLLHETVDASEQPAQTLKTVSVCTLYTDNKEL
ncbi:MAG: hypothetical protein JWM07_296 [Candidatus Saccharibacteria bacterium]|nr:hypothetical protein [Candidatus Saccharibacteria bacterium]